MDGGEFGVGVGIWWIDFTIRFDVKERGRERMMMLAKQTPSIMFSKTNPYLSS